MTEPWTVLASGLAFPEGPAFAPDGALWCVELQGGALIRMSASGPIRVPVGGAPNGLTFDRRGHAWFCDADACAIRRYEPATGACETVVVSSASAEFRRPNDLAFGPRGELVFTCPGNSRTEPTGTVWCLSMDGRLSIVADGMYFPNGLAFGGDGRTLVVAETYRHRLWRGGWDSGQLTWVSPKPFVTVGGPIGPDGMAFSQDGRLHVAVFGQRAIKVVTSSGAVSSVLPLAGARPTNCAFDPSGRLGLVVTEAGQGELVSRADLGTGVTLFGGAI